MSGNFEWYNDISKRFMEGSYLIDGVTIEQRVREIADTAERYLKMEGFADKFYDYMSRGWYSLSTPVWTNYGNMRGTPISCFGSFVDDNMESILYTTAEVGMMSKFGGGTSGYFGALRPRGAEIRNNGKTSGSVHFMQLFDAVANVVSQGCYDEETEILTENGWMSFSDLSEVWKTTKVAQVNDNEEIEFVYPTEYFKYKVKENLLHFKDSRNIDLLVTKNHNMVFKYEKKSIIRDDSGAKKYKRFISDEFRSSTAEKCPLHRDVKFLHSAKLSEAEGRLTAMERLQIAFQADGYSTKKHPNYVRFRFAKKRKAERLEWILKEAGIKYKTSFYEKDGTYNYFLSLDTPLSKTFDWVDIKTRSYQWALEFLLEVSEWDGNKASDTLITYSSIRKDVVDVIQEVAACAGYKSKVSLNLRLSEPNKQPIYNMTLSPGMYFGVEKIVPDEVYYEGFVYCVEVPSHRLIVRRGGHTLVCGNSSRRGSFAAYLDIDHPDIEEFLDLRTEGNIIQDLSYGVCISDEWMKSMLDGDTSKRSLWAKIIQRRYEYGFPYIFFAGNVNKGTVDVYKDKGMKIHASNLCSEIMLPSSSDESFVCCLSSMNLLHYDDWKNTDAVQVLTMFLDTVITDFIKFTKGVLFMERSRNFAKNHRALGIGVLGWHSYLQKNNLPFGGVPTTLKNAEIFKYLAQETKAASEKLAKRFGEPKVLKGYGRRNTTLMAIAPTVSSATILGQVSPSIEPLSSNYFIADKAKLKYTYKNPYLMEVLNKYGENTEETWRSILDNFGSVQHLPFLTDDEKEVFLTFSEISQKDIVTQAAVRQNFIDQGQSLNLMIHPDTSAKDVSQLMIEAWKNGVKSLYYQHSINAAQKFSKNLLNCSSCEA